MHIEVKEVSIPSEHEQNPDEYPGEGVYINVISNYILQVYALDGMLYVTILGTDLSKHVIKYNEITEKQDPDTINIDKLTTLVKAFRGIK